VFHNHRPGEEFERRTVVMPADRAQMPIPTQHFPPFHHHSGLLRFASFSIDREQTCSNSVEPLTAASTQLNRM